MPLTKEEIELRPLLKANFGLLVVEGVRTSYHPSSLASRNLGIAKARLWENPTPTLKQLGEHCGVTPERVRQILAKFYQKFRPLAIEAERRGDD